MTKPKPKTALLRAYGDGYTKLINIRVNEEQHKALKRAAKRAGMELGPWLRALGLREAGEPELSLIKL